MEAAVAVDRPLVAVQLAADVGPVAAFVVAAAVAAENFPTFPNCDIYQQHVSSVNITFGARKVTFTES